MAKQKESVHRPGTCLTPGCGKARTKNTWYCDGCNKDFRADQDKRRGTAGSYPNGFNQTTLVRGNDGADAVVSVAEGVKLDPPLRLRDGVILNGEYKGEKWADAKGEILGRADHEGEKTVSKPKNLCIVEGCTKKAPSGYQTCNDHARFEPKSTKVWDSGYAPITGGKTTVPCDSPGSGHDGTVVVWTLAGGKCLYGAKGSSMTAKSMAHLDLVLDCANVGPEVGKFIKACPARFRRLLKSVKPERIVFDWPDMSAPVQMGIRFWQDLLAMLPQHTCACCFGGHGRTGTCLAALLVASGLTGEDAIRIVRERHCKRAIETAGQEAYIKALAKAREELEAELKPEPVAEGGA